MFHCEFFKPGTKLTYNWHTREDVVAQSIQLSPEVDRFDPSHVYA